MLLHTEKNGEPRFSVFCATNTANVRAYRRDLDRPRRQRAEVCRLTARAREDPIGSLRKSAEMRAV